MKYQGQIVDHRYGKAGVRLLRLDRSAATHRLFEATVQISLEGPFSEAYSAGDNRRVLPTDTMKNTVYALARRHEFDTPESLARLLARHFVGTQEQVEKASVDVAEKPWLRHADRSAAFIAGGEERFTTTVVASAEGESVSSGIDGLVILKSSRSGFEGFPRDEFTLLKETDDRILATRLEARWDYADAANVDFAAARGRIQTAMLDAFADHDSRSVQHTLYEMAEAALAAASEIERIFLRMPNKHYLLARLEPLGLDNPNCIFVPTDEPAGMIEGTVERVSA
ncbi:MAG: urate oxidase [Thermoanaerobaculia bacterium]|nr:urate oxidase [Thermoanaerobaculia bacterium]